MYFLTVATSKDHDSRPKLVISKALRKYIKRKNKCVVNGILYYFTELYLTKLV